MAHPEIMAGVRQPGGRAPAPQSLRLVQQFVNSVDREHGPDLFADPAGLARWLADRGLLSPGATVSELEWRQAIEMREGLRALALHNNGVALDADAIARLNAAARSADLLVRFDDAGDAVLRPVRAGVDGALAHLLGDVARAMGDGTWARLKACPNDVCHWAFYDHSRNGSGTWCSMRICGNRTKGRAYRRRRG